MNRFMIACVALLGMALSANADGLEIQDAYARSSNPKVAAVFMTILNDTGADDRLVAVRSDVARRSEVHTHREEDGVMRMIHLEDGLAVPKGGATTLARGGHHLMLMGLEAPLSPGDTVDVTLVFDQAGDVTIEVTVDNARQ